jgi:uncharacterized damage-inducible protein DinB
MAISLDAKWLAEADASSECDVPTKTLEPLGHVAESKYGIDMEIRNSREFLEYYEKVRQRTLKVIACIPEDRFDWRYADNKFSFADIIRHVAAIERYMYAENVQLKPSRYPGHGKELADGPGGVLDFFNRLHGESVEIFSRLTEDDLQKRCRTPGGTEITIWKWLRAMVEHEIHHRAQLYVYLGLLGLPSPPIYGLTSEQVRERSEILE